MNKNTYRIVFNESRGCLMAVAETATSQGKSASGERGDSASAQGLHRTMGTIALACKLVSQTVLLSVAALWFAPIQAQTVATRIVADPSAARNQQATVLNASNGVVQVNIQSPSAAGVSRNTYSQFDVGNQGAILNNSRTNVQTQLGGWVQGNPWLATGSARVILNEVNSSNPSYLQGYVEVAGQRAEVIIANPSGIAVNGGGFLNASSVTLTTGTPVVNNGNLESYRVQRGSVSIDGAGLDTRSADYTTILSRAAQINAGIWANRLQVVTGANQIESSSLGSDAIVQSTTIAAAGTTPTYALDVGQLGGMYAGKIMLIGTEAGLGVRNAGLVQASSGPLTLTQEGWLSNSGTLQAAGGDVQIQTRGTIEQSGTVYSDKSVLLASQSNQTHSGTTAALGNVNIQALGANSDGTAAHIQASHTTVWAAGLQTDGQLSGQQSLSVQATGQVQTAGQALATSTLNVQGASLDLSQSRLQAPALNLQASSGELNATASQLLATEQLQLKTPQALITDGAKVQAGTLGITANSLSNVAGQIVQTGTTDQAIALQGSLNNRAGVIQSSANNLSISAQSIDNTAGQLLHAGSGSLQLTSQGQLLNYTQSSAQAAVTDGARIVSTGALNISSAELANSGSVYAAKDLSTQASSLNNSRSIYAAGQQTLTVSGAIANSGTIAAAKDLKVSAASLSGTSTHVLAAGMAADGQLTGTGALSVVTTGALQSAGQILATGKVSMTGPSLDLSGSTSVTGSTTADVRLTASNGDILTRNAKLSTPGLLTLTANTQASQKLDNTAGQISAAQLDIRTGQLNNSQGVIYQTATGVQTASIQSTGTVNNSAGRIVANAQNFSLSAGGALTNTDGLIGHAGSGQLTLGMASLDNTRGQIVGNGAATLSSAGAVTNTDGLIALQNDLSIRSADLSNTASGAVTTATGIQSQTGNLTLNAQALTNTSQIVAARDLSTTAASVSNSGTMYAGANQSLTVGNAITSSGTIAAAQSLTVTATSLAAASASVMAAGMTYDGKLTGTGSLSITTTGTLQSAGQTLATGQVSLAGASQDLSNSVVGSTTGDVHLSASSGNILTKHAQVSTPGLLSITANGAATQALDNTQGQLSGQQMSIQVGQLNNTQGVIQQTGTGVQRASILTAGAVTNTSGAILANAQDFTLQSGGKLDNTDGQIGHAGTGTFTLSTAATDNTRGRILGNAALNFSATGDINNTSGLVAAQSLNASATGWNNSQGKLVSTQGDLSLHTTQNVVTNSAGLIQSAQDLRLSLEGSANSLQNSQGKIIAARDATLSGGPLANDAGLIAAGRNLAIDTHGQSLSNLGSRSSSSTLGLIAGQQLDIHSGAVDNRAGLISAQGALNLTSTGSVSNAANNGQASLIYSGSDLTLQTTGLDNTASQILAVGNASLNTGSGSLTNTSGLVRVGQTLTVQSASVDNTLTRAFNADGTPKAMGLEGNSIAITTGSLNNTQGAVRAAQDLSIYSDGQLINNQGELSAGRNLLITTGQASTSSTTPTLRISNQAGQIVADQSVNVRTASLSGAGTLASRGDVTLSLQGDHTLAGTLQAGGNLNLSATGQITNPISVQAGKNLSVSARDLDNQASGELLSGQTTQLTISNTLTNRGLIDGADTRIQSNAVNNLGTGRLYGDRVAIAATTLTNQEETLSGVTHAATIAGRQQVDLGIQTLTNRENALIYSGGDLGLGGALDANWRATGTAQLVNNNSATIEAAQNLSIQATDIRNTNEHFASEVRQTSQVAITEYQGSGATQRYAQGTPDVNTYLDESLHLHTPDGNYEQWTQYDYTRTVNESVVTQSAPGKILAGGGITLTAANVLNDKSQIVAGGTLSVQATNLNNVQAQGTKTTTDAGTATSYWRVFQKGTDSTGSSATAYAPAPVQETTTLSANRYEQNTANAATGTAPMASTLSTVAAQASGLGSVTAAAATASLSTVNGVQTAMATGTAIAGQTGMQAQISRISTALASAAAAPSSTHGQSGSTQTQIRTALPDTRIPNTSLYKTHPEPGAKYLVETDPKFTQYKTWLGSDYMLNALNLDPAATQKRLGDGFYEQKLVRDQVLALTGNRYLGNYTSDEQEYKALMDSGLTYARQWNLRPGIALTAEQVAQLTSDMVWLVTQEVTLADGSKQSVLVPQVYVRVQPGDIDGSGALLAGKDVNLNLSGDATNSGTIAGRNLVQINANNIKNMGGTLSADTLALQAKEDIDNIGGQMKAQSAALLSAGRDINLSTTTQSSANKAGANSFAQTGIDRVAGLYVSGPAGVLIASAGRDLNLTAAQLQNTGTGTTVLSAGHNLNLSTVTTASSQSLVWDANNRLYQSASLDVGTQINTAGSLTLQAGQDINAKAATVNAAQTLTAIAAGSINLTAGQSTQSLDEAHQHTSSGFLSSKTVTTRDQLQSTNAIGTNFEGQSVNLATGKDLAIFGSNVLADQNVNLNAGGNVSITAAQNTQSSSSFSQTTKSGLMSGGGLSISIGTQQQSLDQGQTQTTAAASTVGSTGGNVTITAGQSYTQTGSDVMTPKGNIDITAKAVTIDEARETGSQSSEQKFKQSGLTVAVTSPVISALQGVQQQAQAAGNTGSDRMKALAVANAAMQVKQGASQVQDALSKGDATGGAGISVSLGSSSSQSSSQSSADNAKGSNLTAGGNIQIQATGAGANSKLTVQGSSVKAVGTTTLQADNQVSLLAASNTTQESSANKSSSASIGVAISTQGVGFTASASKATGQGAGNGTTYTNTHVEGGQQVVIQSGGDTTLKGATVTGHQITAQVGGDLNVQSLQDTNQYKESSKSVGGSVMVGITSTGPAGGSLSLGKTSINSTFTSVNEQSAIRAGDGGFNVNVQGKTQLTGGQITSTQAAVDAGKNAFTSAGGTTTTDLQNSASYSAQSVSIGLGTGTPSPDAALSAGLSGVGIGSDKGSASSTTTAGISGVAGNAQARTGDKSASLTPIFNKDQVQKEVAAQVAITQEFGKQASKIGGSEADKQRDALKAQANAEADPTKKAALQAEAAKWDEGGAYRAAMHTVIGGLTGGAAGAVGAGAASAAAPALDQLQSQLQDGLQKAGMGADTSKVIASLASGATAAGIGAAASGGSVAGAATAFNADMNNRQLHPTEVQKAKELAAKSGGKYTQAQIEEQMRLMGNAVTGEQPNTTTALTSTDAIARNIQNDPSMPKTAQGSAVVEVPGKANTELQGWIINNTTQGAGYIPGQSPYSASNAALNGPTLRTDIKTDAPTAAVGNNDVAGKSGVGVQQNAPLTQQTREAIADAASDVSRQAGVIGAAATAATAAATPQVKPITGSVAVGATVIGVAADVVEQMARPDVGVTTTNAVGTIIQTAVERLPGAKGVAPITNEIIEAWKNSGSSRSIQDWMNESFGRADK